jgi:hypothetical protein
MTDWGIMAAKRGSCRFSSPEGEDYTHVENPGKAAAGENCRFLPAAWLILMRSL